MQKCCVCGGFAASRVNEDNDTPRRRPEDALFLRSNIANPIVRLGETPGAPELPLLGKRIRWRVVEVEVV